MTDHEAPAEFGKLLDAFGAVSHLPAGRRFNEARAAVEAAFDLERQRAERYRVALADLVQYLDDHDWGHVPEPVDVTVAARAALAGEPKS